MRKILIAGTAIVAMFACTIASAQSSANTGASPGNQETGGWAVVSANGRLEANSNATMVKHHDVGVYDVKFNGDVSDCSANATIGGSRRKPLPGYILVLQHGDEVRVHTFAVTTLLP